jgi:hypothetical protein
MTEQGNIIDRIDRDIQELKMKLALLEREKSFLIERDQRVFLQEAKNNERRKG